MIPKKRQFGFTLVELMVVLAIIGLLAAIGIPSYAEATRNARDNKRKADIETIRQALVLHRADNSAYISSTPANLPTALSNAGYLAQPLPPAPSSYTTGPNTFCVCAQLEGNTGNSATSANCNTLTTSGGFYCARQP